MAEVSYPIAGGKSVVDAAYERLLGPITGAGRVGFSPTQTQLDTPLIYADNTGRHVKARANQAIIIRGYRWESGSTPPVVPLDANTSGNPRMDLIVARLSRSSWIIRLGVTKGTPAATPAVPAAVQDPGPDGVYELPLAAVRVNSSGVNGQPSILATDVRALDWWIAPPAIITSSAQMPPVSPGMVVHQYNTNRTVRGVGAVWKIIGENGNRQSLDATAGWTNTNIFAQRINGWTHFQCFNTLNIADRAPNQDMNVLMLPEQFRPENDFFFHCFMSPYQPAQGFVDAATGAVTINAYGAVFPKGGRLYIGPLAWPSSY